MRLGDSTPVKKIIDVSIGGSDEDPVQMLAVGMDVEYTNINNVLKVTNRTYYTYGWGSNQSSKAGLNLSVGDETRAYASPTDIFMDSNKQPIELLEDGAQIKALAAGGQHSAAFDTKGIVYTWGNNEFGQLGNFTHDSESHSEPGLVDEARIAIYSVKEEQLGVFVEEVERTETENYNFTLPYNDPTSGMDPISEKLVAKYLYSFSVDQEVDEKRTEKLTYRLLDDANVEVSGLSMEGTDRRQEHISFSMDDVHSIITTYEDVVIAADNTTPKSYGQTRLMVEYEPEVGETGRIARVGTALVDVLGADVVDSVDPSIIHPFRTLPDVKAGNGFTVALRMDGTVLSWGDNTSGRLGQGSLAENNITPTEVTIPFDLTNFPDSYITKIAVGAAHVIAVDNYGQVWAWGNNEYGQLGLGQGDTVSRNVPEQVTIPVAAGEAVPRFVTVYTTDNSSFLVTAQGDVYAFGKDEDFMVDLGYDTVPTAMKMLNHTLEVSQGYVLKNSGSIWKLPDSKESPDIVKARIENVSYPNVERQICPFRLSCQYGYLQRRSDPHRRSRTGDRCRRQALGLRLQRPGPVGQRQRQRFRVPDPHYGAWGGRK